MANSKEELLNFQRDGEIPCAPLGLIQSSRGQYCWWDRRSVFGEISQILSNISFTRGKNSPIPITLLLAGSRRGIPSLVMLSTEPVHIHLRILRFAI